ncbi:MAG: ATP-binding protein [Candidatus Pacearchaeota archaeon]|nr:ATP-binding protein [Candidatus Pacearchaeota archaeon]
MNLTIKEFKNLLNIKKTTEIEEFLLKLNISPSNKPPTGYEYKWHPVGGSLSNAANIENTSVSIAPIIERITNAFDANIELSYLRSGSKEMPASPRKAIERYFKVPSGDMGKYALSLNDKEREKLASLSKVIFYDSDDERKPSIAIIDEGIGQHPSDFKSTLLKLGESNKISSPHLHGTYGHGGSSTFRFCDYSIIISRRHKDSLNNKEDLIGWTIIRKDTSMEIFDEREGKVVHIKKPPVYQYLCLESGEIPYMKPAEGTNFDYGTYIIHISYNSYGWHNLSRGLGYRLFRNFLFDSVLPFRLEDRRKDSDSFNRNMFGARSTLLGSKDVAYSNGIGTEQYFSDGGILKVRYWLLFNSLDPSSRPLNNYLERENSRNSIIITLNGQRHGIMEKNIISRELRLSNVSECLLVQIDIDNLSREMKAGLFTSSRENILEEGEGVILIKQKLKEILDEDASLKEWERKLMVQTSKTVDDESINSVKKILNKLIQTGILPGVGGSQEFKTEGGIGTKLKYKPQDPPTSLRFITFQNPIEVIQGGSKTFNLEINAPDNFFTRRKNRGKLISSFSGEDLIISYHLRELKDGRLPITLFAKDDAEMFNTKKIKFMLKSDNLKVSLEVERDLMIISPPIFISSDPPTEFMILRVPPIELHRGKSNSLSISMNGPEDIFTRVNGKAEFVLEGLHSKVQLERIKSPNKGRMQIALHVDEDAELGSSFVATIKLKLSNGSTLSDSKRMIIVNPKDKNNNKGDKTTVTLPNYEIKWISKQDWNKFYPNWDETTVGRFDLSRDEDDREKLILSINVDNENIISEIDRRKSLAQNNTASSILNRYVAYIAYHLYLVYQSETEDSISEESLVCFLHPLLPILLLSHFLTFFSSLVKHHS